MLFSRKKNGFRSVNKPGVRLKATVHFKGEKIPTLLQKNINMSRIK